MGHRAAGRNAVELVGQRAGRAFAAADVSGARAVDRRVDALRPAGAEFQNGAALRGPHDAVGLRRDEALVVERQQQKRLDELRLNGGRADGHDRLAREDRRALRHGPDIAREAEAAQILQEALVEHIPAAQIRNIVLVKMKLLHVLDRLLQTRRDGKAAVIGHGAEENIKIRDAVLHTLHEIAVAHGELVIIAEHTQIGVFVDIHDRFPSFFCRMGTWAVYSASARARCSLLSGCSDR